MDAVGGGRQHDQVPEVEQLRRRLSLVPDNIDARLRLVACLAQSYRYGDALEELRTLIRLDPNNLLARRLREELLEQARRRPAPPSGAPPRR